MTRLAYVAKAADICAIMFVLAALLSASWAMADDGCTTGSCPKGYTCNLITGQCVLAPCPAKCPNGCAGAPPCPSGSNSCHQVDETDCSACGCTETDPGRCGCAN